MEYGGAFDLPETTQPSDSRAAVAFLQETVHRYPGSVTVVSLGPMTVLALAIRDDPSFARDVGEIVIMGGAIGGKGNATHLAEFNAWFDPEAARIVLRSAIRRKLIFDLQACEQAIITSREFEAITVSDTPFTRIYRDHMGHAYPGFLQNPSATVPMWDALVAAYLIDSTVVTNFTEVFLDVNVEFGPSYGATDHVEHYDDGGRALLATGIDSFKALRLYCDLLSESRTPEQDTKSPRSSLSEGGRA